MKRATRCWRVPADSGKTVERQAIHRDLAEKLLAHVSAEDRAILQMLYAEEMTISDISEITGWSNGPDQGPRPPRAPRAAKDNQKVFVTGGEGKNVF